MRVRNRPTALHDRPVESCRIALLGNMNNNLFTLMRYLREAGLDAHLFVYRTDTSLPEFDSSSDLEYVHLMDIRIRNLLAVFPRRQQAQLEGFQVLIGCGLAPALCARLGRRLDVFAPYGSDLSDLPFPSPGGLLRRMLWAPIRALQSRGIQESRITHMIESVSEEFEEALSETGFTGERWNGPLPLVYGPDFESQGTPFESEEITPTEAGGLVGVHIETTFMAFAHGRHHWGRSSDLNAKGCEHLIRGWAEFVSREITMTPLLVLFEYGPDVGRTKSLIAELDCEQSVAWQPKMPRRELMKRLANCDVVCGNFAHSYLSSGCYFEALVLGKPIIGYRSKEHLTAANAFPILAAREPGDIADQLSWAARCPNDAAELGIAGREWYKSQTLSALSRYNMLCS